MSDHYPVEVELKSLSYVEGNLHIRCVLLIRLYQKEKKQKHEQPEWLVLFLRAEVPVLPPGMVAVDADLMELKRGNLLLEREKLGLEIQILRAKMSKLNQGDGVWNLL